MPKSRSSNKPARAKGPSSSRGRVSARDKLLNAADELFYAHGIASVGIDRVIARAGVAKMSLYNHFDSKDALVAAWLERKHADWMAWLSGQVVKSPVISRPLAVFDALDQWFNTDDFRGCAFINVAAEVKDPRSKAFQISAAHSAAVNRAFRDLVAAAHPALDDPTLDRIAQELTMLAVGAILWAAMHGPDQAAPRARESAARLLASHALR